MSFLNVAPDLVAAAAGSVQSIGSALNEANAVAAAPTTEVLPPAADQVSAAVTAVFGTHARQFQSLSAQAAAFHEQFVGLLNAGAAAYTNTEAAVQALLGHPLIGPVAGDPSAATAIEYGLIAALLGITLSGENSFTLPFGLNTPLGAVSGTLTGALSPDGVVFDSGTLAVPASLKYGVDAIGPAITTTAALQTSSATFANAVQTGDVLGAAGALIQAPGSALSGFLFGESTITQTIPVAGGSVLDSASLSIPVGGLLAPIQIASLTLTPTGGEPTTIDLTGPRFGGLLTGLLDDFVPGF